LKRRNVDRAKAQKSEEIVFSDESFGHFQSRGDLGLPQRNARDKWDAPVLKVRSLHRSEDRLHIGGHADIVKVKKNGLAIATSDGENSEVQPDESN
jgi:hypothetical protein